MENWHYPDDWAELFKEEFEQEYFKKIAQKLQEAYEAGKIIYPEFNDTFNAFYHCPLSKLKVILLGQDPYHNPGQAHGLSFSVAHGQKIPPSLKNIFKELHNDLGIAIPKHGNLTSWAQQGVLLLNSSLSVEHQNPMSHSKLGWTIFTDQIIRKLSVQKEHLVFILWGNAAQQKATLIDANKHLILQAAHPSPLSAYQGFWHCKHFSKTNEYLISKQKAPIHWEL